MDKDEVKRNARVALHQLRRPRAFARSVGRAPLEASAAERIAALPRIELTDLVTAGEHQLRVAAPDSRHAWSLGIAEQLFLQLLIRERSMSSVFEIGTFNGGTTLLMAKAITPPGRVVTLDLPPDDFDRSQAPKAFTGRQVGQAFADAPERALITQELGDSLTYDFADHAGGYDLVLVDGAHDYEHGFADTKSALCIVRPGGVIVWDDFEPYWHGLVHGILDAAGTAGIAKLAGSSFAVLDLARGDGPTAPR